MTTATNVPSMNARRARFVFQAAGNTFEEGLNIIVSKSAFVQVPHLTAKNKGTHRVPPSMLTHWHDGSPIVSNRVKQCTACESDYAAAFCSRCILTCAWTHAEPMNRHGWLRVWRSQCTNVLYMRVRVCTGIRRNSHPPTAQRRMGVAERQPPLSPCCINRRHPNKQRQQNKQMQQRWCNRWCNRSKTPAICAFKAERQEIHVPWTARRSVQTGVHWNGKGAAVAGIYTNPG